MKVKDVLMSKGALVEWVSPRTTVREVLSALAEFGFGALVVSSDGKTVVGIVSERDVVRRIATDGCAALDLDVSEIMTTKVHCCGPDHSIDELMALMTDRRIRHVPVLDNGTLAGVISIGDVVKHRVAELEDANYHLERFVTTGW